MKVKKIIAVLLLSVMGMSIAACGNNDKESDTSGGSGSSGIFSHLTDEEKTEETTGTEEVFTDAVTELTTEEEPEEVDLNGSVRHLSYAIENHCDYDYSSDDDYKIILNTEYNTINLAPEDSFNFPGIADAISEYNESAYLSVREFRNENLQIAEEMYLNSPEIFGQFEDDSKIYIRRADSELFSFMTIHYGYLGGAHGYSYHTCRNIDSATGKDLSLGDVVRDTDAIAKTVCMKLGESYPNLYEYNDDVDEKIMNQFTGEQSDNLLWLVEPDGVIFFFDAYTLGSYADGAQEIKIFFNEFPELFTGDFQNPPEKWAYEFEQYKTVRYARSDENNPGFVGVDVEVNYYDYDDYYWSQNEGYTIYTDRGELKVEDDYFYDMKTTLVNNDDDRFYLVVEKYGDSDWNSMVIYDLSGTNPVEISSISGGITGLAESYYTDGAYSADDSQLTNPENFYIQTRTNMGSTYQIYCNSYINEQGEFVVNDDYYFVIDSPIELTSKVPLTLDDLDLVDLIPVKSGRISVPSGTVFSFYGTDNETYTDFITGNGDIVRIYIDTSDWPETINGTDIEEIFDGVMFAG